MNNRIINISEFLKLKNIAIVGASSKKKKFGNAIMEEMLKRAYNVYPVHPVAEEIDGRKVYRDLASLPGKIDGVVIAVHPEKTEKVVKEAYEAGIMNVWIQQGAASPAAEKYCKQKGMRLVSKECMLMYLDSPGFPHSFHKWLKHPFGAH